MAKIGKYSQVPYVRAEKMRALSPFRALNVSLENEENDSKLSLYILKFCIV